MAEIHPEDRLLGPALVSAGYLKREQLGEVLRAIEASPGLRLREELVRRGLVSAEVIDRATEASIQVPPSASGPAPTAPTVPGGPPHQARPTGPPTAATVNPPTAATIGLRPDAEPAPGEKLPPEVAQAAENPKNRFSKYVLVRQLGRGGMAVVYKAWDSFLHHFVALKFIKTQDIADAGSPAAREQAEQFMAEARLAVRLNHPNIARIYELGQHEDKFYMAQYYIDGPTLHEVVHGTKDRSVDTRFYEDPQRYMKIMRDLADAMAYAHGLTPPIIHRDLKPSNVMLDSAGRAYVVDFGLAKELKVDGGSLSGTVKGTPKYMAPEQAEGRSSEMDGRTDIWALGVILYEMLTGRAPFEDENIHRLLSKIVNEDPPWPRHVVSSRTAKISPSTQGVLSIPRDVEMIAMKCLQKDRRHRYAGGRELVADLDRALGGQQVSAPDYSVYWFVGRLGRMARKHRWTLALAALLLGVVGFVAFDALFRREGPAPPPPVPGPSAGGVSEERRREVARIRDAFLGKPSRETLEPLVKLLSGIEPVLAGSARQGIGDWWVSYLPPREAESKALQGSGKPQKSWLSEDVRRRARELLSDLEFAEAVNGHRQALDLGLADLAKSGGALRAILAWKGTFALSANVLPWASVRVEVGGKDFTGDAARQENLTPLRVAELPVGAVRLEFARDGATKTVEVPEAELRDGAVLRVWGPWEKLERAIE